MKKKILKKRIRFLEEQIRVYYMANYRAKQQIAGIGGIGVCGVSVMEGNEEVMSVNSVEGLKDVINSLPLNDCGV